MDYLESAEGAEETSNLPEQSKEPITGQSMAAVRTLLSNEAIVKSYAELKNALANDNGITKRGFELGCEFIIYNLSHFSI